MTQDSSLRHLLKFLVLAAFLVMGPRPAMAAPEPTLPQVYEAARAGRMEQAQAMMQLVLVAHPNSAKAHFVQAELSARQGQAARAREELAIAERLAPGLAFAKPESVQSLRAQLAQDGGTHAVHPGGMVGHAAATGLRTDAPAPPATAFPWGMALALGAGATALAMFLFRRTPAAGSFGPPGYPTQPLPPNGWSGAQGFGTSGGGPFAPSSAPAPGSGLGGKVMGGLATGLAVGAGVMAAQAIGRNLFGKEEAQAAHLPDQPSHMTTASGNPDLGGQDFGIDDTRSWDDVDSFASQDGGGDWDT